MNYRNVFNENSILILLSLLITLLGLNPILGTGFTTHDDLEYHLVSYSYGNIWTYSLSFAQVQGRIGGFIAVWFTFFPFLIDHEWYYQTIKIISLLLPAISSSLFIYTLFKNKYMMVLNYIFILSFLNIYWNHHLSNAYVFIFHFALALFFIVNILIIKFFEKNQLKYLIAAYIIYFFNLFFYETFVLYWIFLLAVIFTYTNDKKTFFKHALLSLIPVLIYIAIYLIWRRYNPSGYEGNQVHIDFNNLYIIFDTIKTYAISAFPGYTYFTNIAVLDYYSNSLINDNKSFLNILVNIKLEWIIKAIIVAFSSYFLLLNINIEQNVFRRKNILFYMSITMIFLSTFLYGLTKTKQDWVMHGDFAFVGTYFAYIWMVIAFVLFFNYIGRNKFAIIVITVAITYLSLVVDYTNQPVSIDQKVSHKKWIMFNKFAETDFFKTLPSGTIIKSPSIFNHHWNVVQTENYWTLYTKMKFKKDIIFMLTPETYDYELVFKEYLYDNEKYFLILNQKRNNLYIYYTGKNQNTFIRLKTKNPFSHVYLDNNSYTTTEDGTVAINASLLDVKTKNKLLMISTDDEFKIDNISLDFTTQNAEQQAVTFAYDVESGWYSNEMTHIWAGRDNKQNSNIKIYNNINSKMKIIIEAELSSLRDRTIDIKLNGTLIKKITLDQTASKSEKLFFDVILKPGENIVSFNDLNIPITCPETGDPRTFSFSLSKFKINRVSVL